MIKLSDREWKQFNINDLFTIDKVKGLPIENYSKNCGLIPYITTASSNNALSCFVNSCNNAISEGKCLSVDPIKGKVFYHNYNFVGRGFSGASINLLRSKIEINNNIALFLCVAVENTAKHKASYGYLFNGDRLKYAKILLPINKDGKPDYKFMDSYIKQIMHKKINEYAVYIRPD